MKSSMTETRVYAATTGRCLAGEADGANPEERERVEHDLASGVRLVVDEVAGEVRGFVPVDRGSYEAFCATTMFAEGVPVRIEQYVARVEAVFDTRERWEIRYDTPEGAILRKFAATNEQTAETYDAFKNDLERSGGPERIGVPGYKSAVETICDYHDPPRAAGDKEGQTSLISVSSTVDHITSDLLVHVSQEYDAPHTIAVD
jgi:hypothetical protein